MGDFALLVSWQFLSMIINHFAQYETRNTANIANQYYLSYEYKYVLYEKCMKCLFVVKLSLLPQISLNTILQGSLKK